jgi:hypothetical protein
VRSGSNLAVIARFVPPDHIFDFTTILRLSGPGAKNKFGS